jgi:hypothetical protein
MKRLAAALASLFAIATAPAQAASPFCVADGTAFANALAAAAQSSEADEIRLRVGQFSTNANPMFAYSGASALSISGGWTDAACTTQSLTPDSSALNGGVARQVMLITRSGAAADVYLHNLTFQYGLRGNGGGCLQVESLPGAGSNGRVHVYRSRFYTCRSDSGEGAGVLANVVGGQLHLLNNIFAYNVAGAAAAFSVSLQGGLAIANSNSIIGNYAEFTGAGTATGAALRAPSTGTMHAANNVFFANKDWTDQPGGPEFVIDLGSGAATSTASLSHNHYGLAAPPAQPRLSELATSIGDPLLADIPAFMPRPDSPLRDSGKNAPTGGTTAQDFSGRARVQAGTIDRGAYEFEVLLRNGFE